MLIFGLRNNPLPALLPGVLIFCSARLVPLLANETRKYPMLLLSTISTLLFLHRETVTMGGGRYPWYAERLLPSLKKGQCVALCDPGEFPHHPRAASSSLYDLYPAPLHRPAASDRTVAGTCSRRAMPGMAQSVAMRSGRRNHHGTCSGILLQESRLAPPNAKRPWPGTLDGDAWSLRNPVLGAPIDSSTQL